VIDVTALPRISLKRVLSSDRTPAAMVRLGEQRVLTLLEVIRDSDERAIPPRTLVRGG